MLCVFRCALRCLQNCFVSSTARPRSCEDSCLSPYISLPACLPCAPADPAKEAEKMGTDPGRHTRWFEGVSRTGTPFAVDVLRERFLGPEIFFSPDTYSGTGMDCISE